MPADPFACPRMVVWWTLLMTWFTAGYLPMTPVYGPADEPSSSIRRGVIRTNVQEPVFLHPIHERHGLIDTQFLSPLPGNGIIGRSIELITMMDIFLSRMGVAVVNSSGAKSAGARNDGNPIGRSAEATSSPRSPSPLFQTEPHYRHPGRCRSPDEDLHPAVSTWTCLPPFWHLQPTVD